MKQTLSRREALKVSCRAGLALTLPLNFDFWQKSQEMRTRVIPVSGEKIPVVGLGTWQTFDVGDSQSRRTPLKQLLMEMKKMGGTFIDSSPMYGSSESVIGGITSALPCADHFFYATKVWTSGEDSGIRQMKSSLKKMRRNQMDLMQIHNLVDWKTHVKTLRKMKDEGTIRYWGITHYIDAAQSRLEKIIVSDKPDFVQFNYSIRSRHAERSLFETAQKYGTATVINQPFETGSLFRWSRGKALPEWAKEIDIESWAQFFLKFILSHEAVICVIPGTSKPHHLIDNMKAGYGRLPDEAMRNKMAAYLK